MIIYDCILFREIMAIFIIGKSLVSFTKWSNKAKVAFHGVLKSIFIWLPYITTLFGLKEES